MAKYNKRTKLKEEKNEKDFGSFIGNSDVCCTVHRMPVSYTHLDVYKRQARSLPATAGL